MAFGDALKKGTSGNNEPRESPFMHTKPGDYPIRILDTEEFTYWRYWIPVKVGSQMAGRSISVGRDNPIKAAMDALGKDHPKYQSPSRRFVINVFDKTPVVKVNGVAVYANDKGVYIDPATGKEFERVNIEPNNVVKIFEFGTQLLELIANLQGRMRSRSNPAKVLELGETDIVLQIRGEGTKKTIFPAQGFDETPLDMSTLKLYDLQKIYAPLPNDAVDALFNKQADWNEVMQSLGFTGNYPTR